MHYWSEKNVNTLRTTALVFHHFLLAISPSSQHFVPRLLSSQRAGHPVPFPHAIPYVQSTILHLFTRSLKIILASNLTKLHGGLCFLLLRAKHSRRCQGSAARRQSSLQYHTTRHPPQGCSSLSLREYISPQSGPWSKRKGDVKNPVHVTRDFLKGYFL